MFCQYCQAITINALIDAYQHFRRNGGSTSYYRDPPPEPTDEQSVYLAHHPSVSSLSSSAKGSCELCVAIHKELSAVPGRIELIEKLEDEGGDTRVRIAIGQTAEYGRWRMYDHIAVVIGFPRQTSAMSDQDYEKWIKEHEKESFWFKFSLWQCTVSPGRLSDWNQFPDGGVGWPYMGSDFSCEQSFGLARKWIKDCSKKCPDDHCIPLHDAVLPTRVLDLGTSINDQPKILVSDGLHGQYTALSHCWGGDVPCKITVSLLTSYMEALPTLPRTFRDAIKVTRELGFRYLWIDSLCILQDSRKDWEKESASMCDVYRNASITISASASENSHGGMLGSYAYNLPEVRKWCSLQLFPDSPVSETVRLTSFYKKETFTDCMATLPLAHRGWTLQERLLSQRILHYGKDQIYFQCRTHHLNGDGTPVSNLYMSQNGSASALLDLSHPPPPDPHQRIPSSGDWIAQMWRSIISSYTGSRELTMPTDKFPALAGIVALFHEKTKDEFLAGVWERDLAIGLLWRLGNYNNPGLKVWKSFPDRAPSWSWVRWDGWVTNSFDALKIVQDEYSIVLLHHKIQHIGLNPYGEISGGELRLRCWTRKLTFAEMTETIGTPALDVPRDRWSFDDEDENQLRFIKDDQKYTVACMGTFQFGSTDNKYKGFLVLKEKGGSGSDAFERLGVAPRESWKYVGSFDSADWVHMELSIF